MDPLIEGYRRFRAEVWPGQRVRYETLAEGQRPETLVIACSDSRVDPQTIFGAAPGELFVVRNIAGLAPPFQPDGAYHGVSAALEFGVRVLGVKRIVVLGHVDCGGVKALVEGAPAQARDFVAPWMAMAKPVLDALPSPHGADMFDLCEIGVVQLTLANLMSFPWIAERVETGALTLRGFRFAVRSGVLERLDAGVAVAVE
ncbi:MAG: carbonic anhydrase [Caulobacteraceae bacterium]